MIDDSEVMGGAHAGAHAGSLTTGRGLAAARHLAAPEGSEPPAQRGDDDDDDIIKDENQPGFRAFLQQAGGVASPYRCQRLVIEAAFKSAPAACFLQTCIFPTSSRSSSGRAPVWDEMGSDSWRRGFCEANTSEEKRKAPSQKYAPVLFPVE